MGLPRSYNDITVRQWMKVKSILNDKSKNTWLQEIEILHYFSGVAIDAIRAMDAKEFRKQWGELSFLKTDVQAMPLRKSIGGFVPCLKLDSDFKVSQMVDYLETIRMNEGRVDTIADKLLAIVYVKKGEKYNPDKHEEYAEWFANQKLPDVIGAVFFYSVYWQNVEKLILNYLEDSERLITTRMQEVSENRTLIASYLNGAGSIVLTDAGSARA